MPKTKTLVRELRRNIGALIRQRRTERGFSIRELARRGGFDPAYVSRIERGEAGATLRQLERITKPLGCTFTVKITPKEHAVGAEIWL